VVDDAIREATQVVGHQHDPCRLGGHRGALHPHGHAHIGHGEGGAVIDAVADHADDGVRLEQLDLLELLLRLHAGVALCDAHAGAHGARRDGVVAGEHHRRDPQLLECTHRLAAVGTYAVG